LPGNELVDLVDAQDSVVGEATIVRCLEEGLLHRAIAVLVTRSSGMLVLQQRSKRDIWHPGLWTISCTGHVRKGESYEEAAGRELFEELGIGAPVRSIKKYKLPPITAGGLTETEWVALFVCRTDAPCAIDPVELETVREVKESELLDMLDRGPLTPDARLILKDYLSLAGQNQDGS
jgi:isopentenyl-diphosphate delta-isomerase